MGGKESGQERRWGDATCGGAEVRSRELALRS